MLNNRLDEKVIGTAAVTVDILPKGYGMPNVKMDAIKYITIHNTDNWDSTAKNNHKYMSNINKSGERKASWHFTVDDIDIYQAQSTNYKCLHAGNTEGNNTSIGIEICQFRDKDKQLKAYKNAIELVKILMKYHNLSIDKVVQHNKWTGKDCPQVLRAGTYGYNWNWFINRIKEASFTPYTVKINTDSLNVREGAGTSFKVVTQVKRNEVYTIVEEANGWGKLKSGAGWIKLSYTIKK